MNLRTNSQYGNGLLSIGFNQDQGNFSKIYPWFEGNVNSVVLYIYGSSGTITINFEIF